MKQTRDMGAWYVTEGHKQGEEEQTTFKMASEKLYGKNRQAVDSLLLILYKSKPHLYLRSTFKK